MSNEQDRENLNIAMGKLIDQWREYDPEFVAYVERYGGYTDGSAKDKPSSKLAPATPKDKTMLKRLVYRWHDKQGLFCVPCAVNKLHIKRFYLKDVK